MAGDLLPEELLLEILSRLPSETLLRFTSVCKSWYSLITSPRFITTHLLKSPISVGNQVIVRHCCRLTDKYSVHRDNVAFDKIVDFDSPFDGDARIRIIDSFNGLICLTVHYNKSNYHAVYLWNPCIRRIIDIPQPTIKSDWLKDNWETIGFGFNPGTNDYKIINISNYMAAKAELYELTTGSWRIINNSEEYLSKYAVRANTQQAFLNAVVHWVGYDKGVYGCSNLILSFDMKKDEFGVLMLPSSINDRSVCLHVMLFQGSLALIDFIMAEGGNYCCIWVMKEYGVYESWTKQFTIYPNHGVLLKPLGFRENGDALLRRRSSKEYGMTDLVSYDPKTQEIKNLGINTRDIVVADNFVGSLVLLRPFSQKLRMMVREEKLDDNG